MSLHYLLPMTFHRTLFLFFMGHSPFTSKLRTWFAQGRLWFLKHPPYMFKVSFGMYLYNNREGPGSMNFQDVEKTGSSLESPVLEMY